MCLLLWSAIPSRPQSWTVKISISDVDDALSIQTKPCSAPYPHMRMIAVTPGRLALTRDRTVGPDRSVELPGVTAETVITLQLYNDDGPGHMRGVATDGESGRTMFAFSSPRIPSGSLERVWASSWFGDGRPAPLADGCERGLEPAAVRGAAPSARPAVTPFLPEKQRRGWLLIPAGGLLALAVALQLAGIALHAADRGDDLATIRNVIAAATGTAGAFFALTIAFDTEPVVKAVPATASLIGATVAAILSVIEWRVHS